MMFFCKAGAAGFVVKMLQIAGYEAYLVGGCVRDTLLHREPKDFDICTSAEPADVEKLFEKTLAVGAAFGVIIVVLEEYQIEVATFRTDGKYTDGRRPENVSFAKTLKEDVERRDFTINGMAAKSFYDVHDSTVFNIVDYVGGQADLARKLIRCIGDPYERFQEDALRMLRAVRFACQLDFTIEEKTFDAIKESAELVRKVSGERVREELIKILMSPDPYSGLTLMCRCGLMYVLFPEIATGCLGVVFRHLEELKGDPDPLIRLAVLFRDTEFPDLSVKKLKLSNEDMAKLRSAWYASGAFGNFLVRTRAFQVHAVRQPYFDYAWKMFRAQMRALSAPVERTEQAVKALLASDLHPRPLLTGNDLLAMGFAQGKIFSTILYDVETLQLNGKLTTTEEAKAFVQQNYGADQPRDPHDLFGTPTYA